MRVKEWAIFFLYFFSFSIKFVISFYQKKIFVCVLSILKWFHYTHTQHKHQSLPLKGVTVLWCVCVLCTYVIPKKQGKITKEDKMIYFLFVIFFLKILILIFDDTLDLLIRNIEKNGLTKVDPKIVCLFVFRLDFPIGYW